MHTTPFDQYYAGRREVLHMRRGRRVNFIIHDKHHNIERIVASSTDRDNFAKVWGQAIETALAS